jgi:FAD:protein FMN transferase
MSRKTNRREFLQGRAAAGALADTLAGTAAAPPTDRPIVHVARQAMACEFELQFPDDPRRNLTELALETFDLLETLEEQLSFFRPTSELSRVNLIAAEQPVKLEPGLFDLLTQARILSEETDGAWDITATPLWQVWGFAKRKGRIPSDEEIADALKFVGNYRWRLDPAEQTISFAEPGVKLNLGGVGKGYALDRCADRLLAGGMSDFLLHGGQSSVLARGGSDSSTHYWVIGLPDPFHGRRRLAEIRLRDRALGTSSSRFQSFRHAGRLFGHILDPRTGQPAEGVLSATVLAPTAALADALSTAFYVMGEAASVMFCSRRPEISVVLVLPDSGPSGLRVVPIGFEAGDFCPC